MKLIKNIFFQIIKNKLISGSLILFVGNIFASFGNYLYHLTMGRMLGPIDYGILASIISLAYLLSIPVSSLSWVTVKYVSAFRGKKQFREISYFYYWLIKKLIIFSLFALILLLAISPWISEFLHLESIMPLLLIIISSMISIYLTINTAVLQGFLRFGLMSIGGIIQVVLKLGIAIGLVFLGLKVLGAVIGLLFGGLIGFIYTLIFVLRLLEKKEKSISIDTQEIFRYTIPVFFSTLAFVSLYTTDIILARHFLPSQEAGLYASLAVLGKIIYFTASPIIMVMFPMVSERHANGRKYLDLLGLSFGLVFLICFGVSSIYVLFPKLMISLLYGSQYLSAAPYLWYFAIFLSLYTFSFLMTNFYLSIKKVEIVAFSVAAALLQIILIFFFHQTLEQIVLMSIIVMTLLMLGLLLYYFRDESRKKKKKIAFSYCSRL